jgi:hypothetical protein
MPKRKSKEIYLMPEPKWKEIQTAPEDKIDTILRGFEYFVHYEVSDKKQAEALREWLVADSGLDKETVKQLKKVPDGWFGSLSKHCYIWKKSGYMRDAARQYILSAIPELNAKAEHLVEEKEKEEKAPTKPKISIQQRMREQVAELCGVWESLIDELLWAEYDVDKFDPYKDMRSYDGGVIKPAHAKIIKDMYEGQHKEALEIVQWQDEEIKEAFSYMGAKLRKQYLSFYEKINTACDTMISTGKAQRKTRKPKAVSRDKLVSKLKFQINDSELGIASINPTEVVDAAEVWVYNTKNRKLGVYRVAGLATGLTVKGTTIKDFDETKSIQKTLRKPQDQIKAFKGNARTKFQKAFDDIKTTDTKLNGRLNDTTIILKAF